jgi:hypothetical protein
MLIDTETHSVPSRSPGFHLHGTYKRPIYITILVTRFQNRLRLKRPPLTEVSGVDPDLIGILY